jgi:hypothetical protein
VPAEEYERRRMSLWLSRLATREAEACGDSMLVIHSVRLRVVAFLGLSRERREAFAARAETDFSG